MAWRTYSRLKHISSQSNQQSCRVGVMAHQCVRRCRGSCHHPNMAGCQSGFLTGQMEAQTILRSTTGKALFPGWNGSVASEAGRSPSSGWLTTWSARRGQRFVGCVYQIDPWIVAYGNCACVNGKSI